MKERVEALLSSYYEGETSLSEEKELRELLAKVVGFEEEKQFILGLKVLKNIEPSAMPSPRVRGEIKLWQKIAALVALFLSLTWLFIDHQMKKDQAMAYVQVMEAFDLIRENMERGTKSLAAIQDFQHMNKPNEIFNINYKEEQ